MRCTGHVAVKDSSIHFTKLVCLYPLEWLRLCLWSWSCSVGRARAHGRLRERLACALHAHRPERAQRRGDLVLPLQQAPHARANRIVAAREKVRQLRVQALDLIVEAQPAHAAVALCGAPLSDIDHARLAEPLLVLAALVCGDVCGLALARRQRLAFAAAEEAATAACTATFSRWCATAWAKNW